MCGCICRAPRSKITECRWRQWQCAIDAVRVVTSLLPSTDHATWHMRAPTTAPCSTVLNRVPTFPELCALRPWLCVVQLQLSL